MKRRLLPILMTLVLVCALPIWAAFVTSGDVTNPLVCTAGATSSEESAVEKLKLAISNGGTVQLTEDIEITQTLYVERSMTLDLNGCTLRMTGDGSVLKVSGRATLTITDSSAAKSGTITGGNAEYGGGVYVDDYATLKMTGGCITGCHASRGGGGIYSSGNLYMGGTAKIEKCTGSDDAIWNREKSDIYADGGTVDGTVNNQGTIKRSEGAAAVTVFNGTVYNRSAGKIEAGIYGIYNGTVENNGTITGGTFYGAVMIRKGSLSWVSTGSISGGTFYGSIVNEAGPEQVTGGTFAVRFDTDGGSEIEPTMVKHSHTVRPPSDPEKSGHTFVGWEDADGAYDFSKSVIAPLTLTAKWEKVPSSGGNYYYHPTTDTKADDTKGSPKTADPGVALYAALSILSLTGLTCTARKKF
ncbi:MAG: InlB B-repeat-containing protein [Oscillospiraceae bacterium]